MKASKGALNMTKSKKRSTPSNVTTPSAVAATLSAVATTPSAIAATPGVVAATPNAVAATPSVVALTPNAATATSSAVAARPMRLQQRTSYSSRRASCRINEDFHDDDAIDVVAAAELEPASEPSTNGILQVSTRIEYSALPKGQTQDVFGLVTLQANSAPEPSGKETQQERQNMDIVCVLDVSGSMQGEKIQQVQNATRFIVDQADTKDRISIVSFNSTASRQLRLRKMSEEGKDDAMKATFRLVANGGTSIAAGLDSALAIMEQRRQRSKVSAILLLTDGQDGSTRSRLPELMQRASRANCAVYAFGFGSDHDAALLSDIAEQAQTPFTFVENTENIREAFAGTVGGLTSIVAQNVKLNIDAEVPIKALHTPFAVERPSDTKAVVTIPDMFAAEKRDILVELSVPAAPATGPSMVLLNASAQYVDLHQNCLAHTGVVAMEVQCVDEPQPELEPDEDVSAQRGRVEVTRALEEAASASDRGQFDDALNVLDAAEKKMKAKEKQSKVSLALQQELEDARQRMQCQSEWEKGGRAEIRDAMQMHKMQRCTNMMSSVKAPSKKSKAIYCSAVQEEWIAKSKGY